MTGVISLNLSSLTFTIVNVIVQFLFWFHIFKLLYCLRLALFLGDWFHFFFFLSQSCIFSKCSYKINIAAYMYRVLILVVRVKHMVSCRVMSGSLHIFSTDISLLIVKLKVTNKLINCKFICAAEKDVFLISRSPF